METTTEPYFGNQRTLSRNMNPRWIGSPLAHSRSVSTFFLVGSTKHAWKRACRGRLPTRWITDRWPRGSFLFPGVPDERVVIHLMGLRLESERLQTFPLTNSRSLRIAGCFPKRPIPCGSSSCSVPARRYGEGRQEVPPDEQRSHPG